MASIIMVNTLIYSTEISSVEESMKFHGHIINDGGLMFITDAPGLYPELEFKQLNEEEFNQFLYALENNY